MLGRFAGVRECSYCEGKCDEAAKLSLAGLKLARHAQRNPSLIGYLVAITLHGIAISSANDALQIGRGLERSSQCLGRRAARQKILDGFIAALKSERPLELGSL